MAIAYRIEQMPHNPEDAEDLMNTVASEGWSWCCFYPSSNRSFAMFIWTDPHKPIPTRNS